MEGVATQRPPSTVGNLAHQRQQVSFAVAKECHPQIVAWHSGNYVWFVFKLDAAISQPGMRRLNIGHREIED